MVADQARGVVGRARPLLEARVQTLAVVAGLLQRALTVAATADGRAAGVGIALESVLAAAVGAVALRVALGVAAARIFNEARIQAVARTVTGLAVQAFRVATEANRDTFNKRVSNSSLRTSADRLVLGKETLSSRSTIARILAQTVNASLIGSTVVVSHATRRVLQLHWHTRAVSVGNPPSTARADHGPEGHGVDNLTDD